MSDPWTVRERLYLASAVTRIGENNWAAVSKIMRNMAGSRRQVDFFSQKRCAQEYTSLVEAFALPRRKRTDPSAISSQSSLEPSLSATTIVEKLTLERIEELKKIIQQEQAQFRKFVNDIEMIRSGQLDHEVPHVLEQTGSETSMDQVISNADEGVEFKSLDTTAAVTPLVPCPTVVSPKPTNILGIKATEPTVSPVTQPTPGPEDVPEVVPAGSFTQEDKLPNSPRTPSSVSCVSTEFMSPSKPPSLTVIKASSPLTSPSMSPSGTTSAIQGVLLSPSRSISHSPPRQVENEALQEMIQRLQEQQRSSANCLDDSELEAIKQVGPVVKMEPLVIPVPETTIESSDSDEDERPLAKLKGQQKPAAAAAEDIKEVAQASGGVAEEVKVEANERQREKEQPPKRIMPPRGRASGTTPVGQRRKQNSGGSTTSSETSSTIRPTQGGSTSRSPIPVPSPFPDYETYKQWKKMILNVWNMAAGHRHASLFLQPVRDSIAPGYSRVVKRPVDLSTIKRNIENGSLTSTDEVRRDLLMMFANAVMYNASNTDINQMARDMAADVMKHLDDLLVPINAMFSGGGVEATKSLRSNRKRQPPSERR